MPTEKELIAERLRKLDELKKLGVNPYPHTFHTHHHAKEVAEKYSALEQDAKSTEEVVSAGRIMSLRKMGGVTFGHIQDESGRVQFYCKKDQLEDYDLIRLLDIGDIIGLKGNVFKTKTGEVTIKVNKLSVLCKSVRPLPEKWHGLQDIETRYRKRHLDLIMSPEKMQVFRARTKIMDTIRHLLNSRDFVEVDTPVLQPVYGGAAAQPFKTHLNALNMDVFLRISNELYLKRLIIGGFHGVYEFSRDFRNEDIDRTHNPEFTQIEIYQAFADFNDMKELVQDIYTEAAKAVNGSTKISFNRQDIELKKPWKSYTMVESIKKFGEIDVNALKDAELFKLKDKFGLKIKAELTRGRVIQALFEELVEKNLIQPTFITHHPIESTSLCKPCREPEHAGFVERFEPFIAGMEIANAYSELNDPVLQRELFERQAKLHAQGAEEGHPIDEDFLQAIETGMPPTGGVGIGIDRMTMIITGQPSIRDVLFFPFMKM
ncbi:MAG: lysine--tRNA ligase [Candidatus Aenigmarchaeota archaeon]|nr:lysine--tRNA ligase [Candidatus Aenigmarchaeota archaeon]